MSDDWALGAWQFDVGWVIAELRELHTLSPKLIDSKLFTALVSSFLEGYSIVNNDHIDQAAIIRMLIHLHDYSIFVRFDEATIRRYTSLLRAIIDQRTTKAW
ncbi:hypothetical protein [Actinocorallia lasiicapitis]